MGKKLKIAVTGTRGFPDMQGGIENHCENLYTQLAEKGADITVFTRKPYVTYPKSKYKGVSLIPLTCPKHKYLETIVHTFKSVFAARKLKIDVLHIHSIGASFFTLFARLLGMKVVVTHHGQDYKREKWNAFAKAILKLCEVIGMKFSNEIIVITHEISSHVKMRFRRESTVIPNGVVVPHLLDGIRGSSVLKKYNLQANKYILIVGRFVPEKAFDLLIDAFEMTDSKDWRLVIVGSADHRDKYSDLIEEKAKKYNNVILTGFMSGEPLYEIYKYAGLFVLPSYFEGLPIVLLEAMSYGVSCIASDIPGNREVCLSDDRYFSAGNITALTEKIEKFLSVPWHDEDRAKQRDFIRYTYNWQRIADDTSIVYQKLLRKAEPLPPPIEFMDKSKLKIAVLGTRGFPGVQGGVEVHCQNLYPYIVKRGCEVIVFTRKPYMDVVIDSYKGVRFYHLSCPQNKYLEAFVHSLKGVWVAKKLKPDILHIHAIGPSVFSLLARFLGLKVVVTHHGENYKHMKWGVIAKQVLKLCEFIGMKYANSVITITEGISRAVSDKFNRLSYVIPNGVDMPAMSLCNDGRLIELGLKRGSYIINVGRFVPEKGLDVLIDAFNKAAIKNWKLVMVGRADHLDKYSDEIDRKTNRNRNIILTGFLSGEPLCELYSNAGLFVLPSYYEGMPIVLLEAMSYGLSCIASDIPANRILQLSEDRYFKVGDVNALKEKIEEFIDKPWTDEDRQKLRSMIDLKYNWQSISDRILNVYKELVYV